MVLHNPYGPRSAEVGTVAVRHLLHLSGRAIGGWHPHVASQAT
jgi:hypothetical protein